MLKKFSVSNFKNFENRIEVDFGKHSNYEFNKDIVQDDCISKCMVYGINGSGKSNLALAIFDIVLHLTDKEKLVDKYLPFYHNLNSKKLEAEFEYTYIFDGIELIYSYRKKDPFTLTYEKIMIDGVEVFWFDYLQNNGECKLRGTENLNLIQQEDMGGGQISRIKYIKSNSMLFENEVNRTFISFIRSVESMLLFYSLDQNRYQGFRNGGESYTQGILRANKMEDFEVFLKGNQIDYNLVEMNINGIPEIGCRMGKNIVPFSLVASTGTKSLALFFYWYISLNNVSLVYIDEFDAFYHHELAIKLVELLRDKKDTQVIFSTHNTDLLSNDILRPDAYYKIHDNRIDSLSALTSKDLRQAHNIQKMYKAGAFSEQSS